jgi:predicted nuclease of predicted toxin-antitoxin system
VRFLVDEALQDLVAYRLVAAGHDATHVRAIGLQGATDDDVLAHAAGEQQVLITTDTDFGTILALSGAPGPSVLLLRGVGDTIDERVDAILHALPVVEDDLISGTVAVVEIDRIRLRRLPIDDD